MSKVVIVTGGGKGIGAEIARHLLMQNIQVVVAEIDSKLRDTFENSSKPLFIKTDVRSEASVKKLISQTLKHFGRLDAVINNAGVLPDEKTHVEKMPLKLWKKYIDTNLTGTFLLSKHAIPHLKKRKGSIVNIASTKSLQSESNDEAYCASKGGIVALTHAMAVSLGPDVRVNAISPGWINSHRETLRKIDHTQHPAGRVGKPEDVASLVAFLISDQAEFITGQNFIIDGGMTIKMIYS